ncbi:MAG: sigma-70 family RNA polymerase sigma factor [Verrucomicrobiota bacterium]
MSDDVELLRRYAVSHDEAAFAELVRRHLDGVYASALRRVGGDVQLAEDVAQQVFAALARKADGLAGHPYIGAWLYKTTRHEAANIVRRERRRKARERQAWEIDAMNHERDLAVEWNRLSPMLDEAIDRLGARDRAAILLRFVERRGFAEIGATLAISTDAARMRVDRALEKLRGRLARRGLTSTAMALGLALSAHATAPAPLALAASVTGVALAGPAAATASAAGAWVTFMSLTKLQVGAATVALLAVGAALYEHRTAEEMRAWQRAAHLTLTAADGRLAAMERARREAEARRAEIARETERARTTSAAAGTTPPETRSTSQLEIIRQQARARRTLERTHPDYQRLTLEAGRRDIVRQYGALYHELRFTPERIAAFERLMVDHDWLRTDAESAARAEGLPDTGGALDALLAEIERKRATALRELLGPEQYGRYEQFRFDEGVRCEITNWMAGALYPTGTPLTGAQAGALTAILTRHTVANAENRADASAIAWEAALVDARAVLAPAQLPFLESMRAQMAWRKVFYQAIGSIDEAAPATPAGKR